MGSSPGSGDWGVGNGERDTEGSGEFAREWGLGSWKWGVGPPVSGDQGVKMRVMVRERVSKNEGDGEGEGESEGEGEMLCVLSLTCSESANSLITITITINNILLYRYVDMLRKPKLSLRAVKFCFI